MSQNQRARLAAVRRQLEGVDAAAWGYSLEQLNGLAQGMTLDEVGPPSRPVKAGEPSLEELILWAVPHAGTA